jgi:hypothetical protein
LVPSGKADGKIPLVFKERGEDVLPEHIRDDYELRVKEIKQATRIAAISECTKKDPISKENCLGRVY